MKKLNERQNNKGFSLVELIVVIAIMVVLVAVLAPVFTKYIENSRKSTDVQNANSIAESVLADVADGKTYSGLQVAKTGTPSALKEDVKTKGNAVEKGRDFVFEYNSTSNKCAVYVGDSKDGTSTKAVGADLTDETNATNYKDSAEGAWGGTATP